MDNASGLAICHSISCYIFVLVSSVLSIPLSPRPPHMPNKATSHVLLTLLSAAAMLLLTVLSTLWIDRSTQANHQLAQREAIHNDLAGLRTQLEKTLNQRLYLVRGLVALARSQPNFSAADFQYFARELQGIRSLQLAPGGVVRHIYPLAGNEAALGYDLLHDPAVSQLVAEMIRHREFLLAGPIDLRQGGRGLIGRQPIFVPGTVTEGEQFWGFATILIDFDQLVREAGLTEHYPKVDWALRGKDGRGEQGAVFMGNAALFQGDAQRMPVSLPTGSWELAAQPHGGWAQSWPGRGILLLGAALIVLLVVLGTALQLAKLRAIHRARQAEASARQAAEAANQAKSDFLANVSHEVRTPINAVIGFVQMALRAAPEPKIKSYLQKVQGATYILLNLINDILDLSKIEANRLELEQVPFNLEDVFNNLANVVALQAGQKDLELAFHLDPAIPAPLLGDPLRLGQALTNLAVNAVKFTEQGEVVVAAELLKVGDGGTANIRFTVRDSGIGIAADQLARVFAPFTQADSSITRRYGGTGLGLSITKQLIERMGGQIEATSTPGKGSQFFFTLDFKCEDAHRAAFCPLKNGHGLRVLVVDDNLSAREILHEFLGDIAQSVVAADSGEDALRQIGSSPEPFDVILLDWRMPGMDGIETGSRIAAHHAGGEAPTLLMVTAYNSEEVRQQAEAVGIQGFLTKPINPTALIDSLLQVIGMADLVSSSATDGNERFATWRRQLQGHRVLVAEDNGLNQEVIEGLLDHVGIQVVLAQDGNDALDKLSNEDFDAVLMDLQMPGLDGLQATTILRQNSAWRTLPVIAMTAHSRDSDQARCLAVGMNGHISKPIDPELLYHTLSRWLVPTQPQASPVSPAAVAPAVSPAELPILDSAAGLRVVAGNRASQERLLHRFVLDFSNAAKQLRELADDENHVELSHLAHSLKGAAGNIGARRVASRADALESALLADAAPAPIEPLLDALCNDLEQLLQICGSGQTPPVTNSVPAVAVEIAGLLEELTHRLQARKLIADADIEKLRAHFQSNTDASAAVELFAQALDRFDYREAERQLGQLVQSHQPNTAASS